MGRVLSTGCRNLGELDVARKPHKNDVLLSSLWSSAKLDPEPCADSSLWYYGIGLRDTDLLQCLAICTLSLYKVTAQSTCNYVEVDVARLVVQPAKDNGPRGPALSKRQ